MHQDQQHSSGTVVLITVGSRAIGAKITRSLITLVRAA